MPGAPQTVGAILLLDNCRDQAILGRGRTAGPKQLYGELGPFCIQSLDQVAALEVWLNRSFGKGKKFAFDASHSLASGCGLQMLPIAASNRFDAGLGRGENVNIGWPNLNKIVGVRDLLVGKLALTFHNCQEQIAEIANLVTISEMQGIGEVGVDRAVAHQAPVAPGRR